MILSTLTPDFVGAQGLGPFPTPKQEIAVERLNFDPIAQAELIQKLPPEVQAAVYKSVNQTLDLLMQRQEILGCNSKNDITISICIKIHINIVIWRGNNGSMIGFQFHTTWTREWRFGGIKKLEADEGIEGYILDSQGWSFSPNVVYLGIVSQETEGGPGYNYLLTRSTGKFGYLENGQIVRTVNLQTCTKTFFEGDSIDCGGTVIEN
jgi:hypothetical protein